MSLDASCQSQKRSLSNLLGELTMNPDSILKYWHEYVVKSVKKNDGIMSIHSLTMTVHSHLILAL